jgi:type VI secretion system secreted protein VgrG
MGIEMSDFAPDLASSVFELSVVDVEAKLSVVSFRGVERMSRPFAFEVRVVTALDARTLSAELLGRAAHLVLHVGEHARRVHGIVRRVELDGWPGDDPSRTAARLWIAPRLWVLGQGRHSRIFQDRTVSEIVDLVLDGEQIERRWRLARRYEPRGYCVQHQESDLDFVERLLAEEGIFYWFEHPAERDGPEVVVFCDGAELYASVEGAAGVAFRHGTGMNEPGEHVRRFGARSRIRPEATLVREFDFRHPRRWPTGRAGRAADPPKAGGAEGTHLRFYDHRSEFEGAVFDDAEAAQHLEQHRAAALRFSGESRCSRLLPGHAFDLEGHPAPGLDDRYAVITVKHEGHTPEALSRGGGGAARETYSNRFECVLATTPCRPPRPRRRHQQVMETAIVVGPTAHEIHTDAMARIKVQFHWDLDGKLDEHSSCWIRVLQPWAGVGWGTQFIPRVGMEVLVSFVYGDTDAPVVLGCVYNGDHPPPFPLPASKTRSGIRTQSSRGGEGSNELAFEDRKGREQIYVHAQKDLDESVEHDHRTTVGHDQVVRVGGHQTDHVGGNRFEVVDGNRAASVGGRQVVDVRADHVEHIGGDHVIETRGLSSETVGTRDEPSGADLTVWGDYNASASDNVRIRAKQSILLECGRTRLELGPDSVRLRTPSLSLVGDDEAYLIGKDATLKLTGTADLWGSKVTLFGPEAGLLLDHEARVAAPAVHLGGALRPRPTEEQITAVETQTVRLRLSDYRFRPYAGKHYELTCEGVVYAGTTGGDGSVEERVPASAKQATLVLWKKNYPLGRRGLYHLRLGETLPDPSTPRGAMARLGHLGYHRFALRDDLDRSARQVLSDFQRDHQLEPSGELTAETAAKIREVHGS